MISLIFYVIILDLFQIFFVTGMKNFGEITHVSNENLIIDSYHK